MIWVRILVLVYGTSCKVLRTDYTRLRSPSKKALCQNSRWNQIRKSLNDCYRIILSALESLKWSQSCSVMLTLQLHGLWPARLLCLWNSPGQNTGVGSCFLLQGIFPTQGSNPGFPHCRRILDQLSHQGSPSTGVDSLFLLQGILPTRELNWGLLHCRWILYHLPRPY